MKLGKDETVSSVESMRQAVMSHNAAAGREVLKVFTSDDGFFLVHQYADGSETLIRFTAVESATWR